MSKLLMFGIALVLLFALILTGCGGSTTTPTPTQTPVSGQASVNMAGSAFIPQTLRVTVGTTVTWTNNDSITHTVTSNTGLFESGNMAKGATFSHTFNQKGTFDYHCTIHPSMTGKIIVE
jgi:plastocyanin